MDSKAMLESIDRICEIKDFDMFLSSAKELLRVYAGENSAFYLDFKEMHHYHPQDYVDNAKSILRAFAFFLENDLQGGISLERQAQIDVTSDFLEQAQFLLNSRKVHSATPCTIIGAVLEEFLRNWVEEQELDKKISKPSLDAYAKALRTAELITKQDVKDITSWAGLRNSAAHGEWEEVADRKRILTMLESVNLFMQKYGK